MDVGDEIHPRSLMAYLQRLPDPRRRQGRRYPLAGIVGLLILGALNGQSSVRGMWLWARAQRDRLWEPLGFYTAAGMPGLTQLWKVVTQLDPDALDGVLRSWLEREHASAAADAAISVDGKTLRGSRREGAAALRVVEAFGQQMKLVLGQQAFSDGDELGAALTLLRTLPLTGRTVTLDAGLVQRPLVTEILDRGGQYLGVLKDNHPELKAAVDGWIKEELFSPDDAAPAGLGDDRQRTRAH